MQGQGAALSPGQRLALAQLEALADGDAVELLDDGAPTAERGLLRVRVALDCSNVPYASAGIRLHGRERFNLAIPPDFPFQHPLVLADHTRWAGTAHVQWGSQLCLYAAPSVEWNPSDGMRGFIERLALWLERASLGQLDPDDLPLHPPVAYAMANAGVVVVRQDVGDLAPVPEAESGVGETKYPYRLLVGMCEQRGEQRADIVDWLDLDKWRAAYGNGELTTDVRGYPIAGALVVLTTRQLSFEYPDAAQALVEGLEALGVPRADFLAALSQVAAINEQLGEAEGDGDGGRTLRVLVGTPSRRDVGGRLRTHFVCWILDDFGRKVAELSSSVNELSRGILADDARVVELQREVTQLSIGWVATTTVTWASVMEARPEVTHRRDNRSASSWLRDKRVLILGCGALGGPIAEACVRAGARTVTLVDNGTITPGILIRQPYADADIGRPKALVLAARLNSLRSDRPVEAFTGTVQQFVRRRLLKPAELDLVVDATADASVSSLLELDRAASRAAWPTVLTVLIGRNARRGLVAASRPGATGGGRDILRRLTLAGRGAAEGWLRDVAADIFPHDGPGELFHPEPGCSSPTFVGSAAELAALANGLLDTGLRGISGAVRGHAAQPMAAAVMRLDQTDSDAHLPGVAWFGWPNDELALDQASSYEVRVSSAARTQMRAECRRGARLRGPDVETGGLLFGCVDDACRCIWVDIASGPPPDSLLSECYFEHGIEGVEAEIAHQRARTGRLSTYLGIWHAHPYGVAEPSPRDRASMFTLMSAALGGPPQALMLILGGDRPTWTSWVTRAEPPQMFATCIARSSVKAGIHIPAPPLVKGQSAWHGGWRTRREQADRRAGDGFLARLRRRLARRK